MREVDYGKAAEAFIAGMTAAQLNGFIAAALEKLSDDDFERICAGMEDEHEIRRLRGLVLNPRKLDKNVTERKFTQEWNDLESEIGDILLEVGDEDGKYVEEDYGDIYFDGYAVSNDFEEVFAKMLPILEMAWELGIVAKNFFLEILEETEKGIAEYPEWIGAEYSDFQFGESFSACALKLLWLAKDSVEEFVKDTAKLFNNELLLSDFEVALPASVPDGELKSLRNEITKLAAIDDSVDLSDPRCFWRSLKLLTDKVVDPDAYYNALLEDMSEKWFHGIELHKKYALDGDFDKAEKCCARTLGEACRQTTSLDFNTDPEMSLFAARHLPDDPRIPELFDNWLEYAEKTNEPSRAGLAELQKTFFKAPGDCEALRIRFVERKDEKWMPAIFAEWQSYVVAKSLPYHGRSAGTDCWIGWILDYSVFGDAAKFLRKTRKWLSSDFKEPAGWGHGVDFSLLHHLTRVRLRFSDALDKFPVFKNYVSTNSTSPWDYLPGHGKDGKERMEEFLRKHLEEVELPEDEILAAWRSNVRVFMQSPDNVSRARYESPAKWLAIARELNDEVYKRVLANWKSKHNRKRNLWAALAQYDIRK